MSRESAYQKFTGTQAPPAPSSITDVKLKLEDKKPEDEITPENPEQEKTEAAPKEGLESSRIALLARKEAALQKERETLKKEREEWLKQKEEADFYRNKGREFDEIAKTDKIAALKMIGWSDTDIFNALTGVEKKEPTAEDIARQVAQEEAQKIRDDIAKEKEKAEKENNEKLISNLKSDIGLSIKNNAEKFELCSFEGKVAEQQAYDFIVEVLKDSGELISVDEALEMTEALYEEREKARAKLKKLQPKEEPKPEQIEEIPQRGRVPVSNVPQPTEAKPRGQIPPPPPGRRETAAEKRERLIQAIKTGGLTR